MKARLDKQTKLSIQRCNLPPAGGLGVNSIDVKRVSGKLTGNGIELSTRSWSQKLLIPPPQFLLYIKLFR